ncbi:J domain-containing protein [Microvirga sp. W0021]|uniref:J domain-containing protein n=1 Tax=Hohaiivirga grylli TaxID=3133970 RepID=A0ABV0BJ28_9HYPH
MRNPYDILGIKKGADQSEVKKAYRKLAKTWHPDHNADDPKAKEKFSEVNAAYEILGDEKKRGQFDRGEIDAEGKPRFQGFEGFGGGPGAGAGGPSGFENFSFSGGGNPFGGGGNPFGGADDILSSLFGGGRRSSRQRATRGADISATMTVTLEDIASQEKKRIRLPNGRSIDVLLPKGVTDGQIIRLKGLGDEGMGGPAGDALLTVKIANHPNFTVDGSNLRLQLAVDLTDAILGGVVRIPTLTGAVEMKIPPHTDSGKTFRLKGKGLPAKVGNGDLLATVEIHLPSGTDEALVEYARKKRQEKVG